jgi:hypothetical protein
MKDTHAPDGALPGWVGMTSPEYSDRSRRRTAFTRLMAACIRRCSWSVVIWAIVELPWEIDSDTSPPQITALLVSICLLAAVVWRTLKGTVWARYAFGFIGISSVIATAPGLYSEYTAFPARIVLSAVECVLKLTALTAVVLNRVRTGRI